MRTAAGMSSAGRPVASAARNFGTEPGDQPREVAVAELVARGLDARAEERAYRSAPDLAQRADRSLDHSELEPGMAGVHDSDRVVGGEQRSARSRR